MAQAIVEIARNKPAPNKPARGSPLKSCGAPGSARCSARLTHIALALQTLRVCLFGLGQRRRQATVMRNRKPNKYWDFTSVGIVSERENLGVEDAQTTMELGSIH